MGLLAVGAYLRTLRRARGLSQESVARRVDRSTKQVGRWEHGEDEPLASALAAFTEQVGGDPRHVFRLLLVEEATEAQGIALAELHIQLQLGDF